MSSTLENVHQNQTTYQKNSLHQSEPSDVAYTTSSSLYTSFPSKTTSDLEYYILNATTLTPQGVDGYTSLSPDGMTTHQGGLLLAACSWLNGTDGPDSPWLMTMPVCSTRFGSLWAFVAVSLVMSVITLWTVLGNLMVLIALCRYASLRTMSNCLIGNLAVSDLLIAITVLPISATNDLLGFWAFGRFMCTVWLSIDVLCCTASVWGLCTVAFDRYLATVYPVWYHDRRSVAKAVGCVVFVWIFSAIISLAPFFGWRGTFTEVFLFNRGIQRYECVLFTSRSYVIYSANGSFVIPGCLMTFMYIRIFTVLHGKSRDMTRKKLELSNGSDRSSYRGLKRNRISESPEDFSPRTLGEENGRNGFCLSHSSTSSYRVERDFTTTTLVSVTTSSVHGLDNIEDEADQLECKSLLPDPSVSTTHEKPILTNRPTSVGFILPDETPTPEINTENTTETKPCLDSPKQDKPLLNARSNLLVPHSIGRSNSVSLPASDMELRPHSNNYTDHYLDLERRHSHNIAFLTEETEDEQEELHDASPTGLKDNSPYLCLRPPACRRSHSANIIFQGSKDDRNSGHSVNFNFLNSSRDGRRAVFPPTNLLPLPLPLPVPLARQQRPRLGRNSKLTQSMKRRFELREQRATKRMLLIMATFSVCWFPFLIMYVLRAVCGEACRMDQHAVAAIIWLGYVNSSLNPILYTLFNDDFKNAFKKLIGLQGKSPPHCPGRQQGRGKSRWVR